jgi:hypothetical protein
MKQLGYFYIYLLNENDLEISHWDARKIPNENNFVISLEFRLNNPENIDKIVQQFNTFMAYLDSISLN